MTAETLSSFYEERFLSRPHRRLNLMPYQRLALGVLLFDIARADNEIAESEVEVIRDILHSTLGFSEAECQDLILSAEAMSEHSGSLRQAIDIVSEFITPAQRNALDSMLKRVARADGHVTRSEKAHTRKIERWLGLVR